MNRLIVKVRKKEMARLLVSWSQLSNVRHDIQTGKIITYPRLINKRKREGKKLFTGFIMLFFF
jgi:hypothetical protein